MKKIEYYQFMKWDGGDRHYPNDPCFFNKEDADEFIKDNKYDRFDIKTVYIFESLDDYNMYASDKLREQALSKLSDMEKRALGLI